MVDAGADDGEPQGDVHPVHEVQEFERDEPLVVVHADDGGELALLVAPEQGVGREGTLYGQARRLGLFMHHLPTHGKAGSNSYYFNIELNRYQKHRGYRTSSFICLSLPVGNCIFSNNGYKF